MSAFRLMLLMSLFGHGEFQQCGPQTLNKCTLEYGTSSCSGKGLEFDLRTTPANCLCQVLANDDSFINSNFGPRNETLLHVATSIWWQDHAKVLIRFGADLERRDADGETALHRAIKTRKWAMAKLLLDHGSNAQQESENMYILTSLEFGSPEFVKLLLEAGADPNALYYDGNTPLHRAAFFDDVKSARYLLEAGANVSALNGAGAPPIAYAGFFECGGGGMEALLLGFGADSEYRNRWGRTLLQEAIHHDCFGVFKALVRGGADVDALDERGRAPIVLAYYLHNWMSAVGYIEVLAEAGANLDVPASAGSSTGNTVLHLAMMSDYVDVDVVNALIWVGAGVTVKNAKGETPLHLSVHQEWNQYEYGYHEFAAGLIKNGADVDAVTEDLETPAHYAAREDAMLLLEELVKGGADLEMRDLQGNTPLHLAAANSATDVARKLVELGVRLDVENKDGQTPYDVATTDFVREILAEAGIGS